MQIGSCWTKTEEKEDGKKSVTGISISLDESILEIYPQLKNIRFVLKPLTAEQRGEKQNAPHWRLTMYKPQPQTAAAGDGGVTDEEIPF